MDERARESLTARSNRSITGDDEKKPWSEHGHLPGHSVVGIESPRVGLGKGIVRRRAEVHPPLHVGIPAWDAKHEVDPASTVHVDDGAFHSTAGGQRGGVVQHGLVDDL